MSTEMYHVYRKRDLVKRQFLCDMHSLMSMGFLMYLFMNNFLPEYLFAFVCNLMMFYDWRECVMRVLGTTKHS